MSTTVIEALRRGLADEMAADTRVIAMGEDIGIGGSFHLSLGLLERFGPERILDTPVAEAGFVGLAIGAAIGGLRPVVDFQYGDFLLPAADQIIQQASKFRLMSGGKVRVPLTLHAPTGASGRGAQHANSIENLFFGVPGLAVGVPSNPYDAKGMFTTAIRHPDPVLICSHKHLYGSKGRAVEATALGDIPDEPYELPIGKAEIRRPGADVTIVGALLMVHRALAAAETLAAEGIDAEVIDLRWLSPMDTDTVVESVRKTGRCIIVQEGSPLGGWSGAVAAAVADRAIEYLDGPVKSITGPTTGIPFAPHLEAQVIPTAERIVAEARALVGAN
jgi:acetoin:2,6-dichlorophenolindophenol oxidoreductase subunit beta